MPRRCRLCKKPVVEDSIFCEQHRSQAQLFSATFGSDDEHGDGQAGLGPGITLTKGRPTSGRRPAFARDGGALMTTEAEPELTGSELARMVRDSFDKIRERAKALAIRDAARWPQISIYYLHDRLHTRAYYSIIPEAGEGESSPSSFKLVDEPVQEAITGDGLVLSRLEELFVERAESLRGRTLQTLDLHLLTYAGLIAINEHFPNQREENLATFALGAGGEGFTAVDPAEVSARLRHMRW